LPEFNQAQVRSTGRLVNALKNQGHRFFQESSCHSVYHAPSNAPKVSVWKPENDAAKQQAESAYVAYLAWELQAGARTVIAGEEHFTPHGSFIMPAPKERPGTPMGGDNESETFETIENKKYPVVKESQEDEEPDLVRVEAVSSDESAIPSATPSVPQGLVSSVTTKLFWWLGY
jgi:hypothetical protein